jgi:hypothetical protein
MGKKRFLWLTHACLLSQTLHVGHKLYKYSRKTFFVLSFESISFFQSFCTKKKFRRRTRQVDLVPFFVFAIKNVFLINYWTFCVSWLSYSDLKVKLLYMPKLTTNFNSRKWIKSSHWILRVVATHFPEKRRNNFPKAIIYSKSISGRLLVSR